MGRREASDDGRRRRRHLYLDVWTGCSDESTVDRDRFCAPPVKALGVTLNGEVVFTKASLAIERAEVALHLIGTRENEIMVSADGVRGAAARFATSPSGRRRRFQRSRRSAATNARPMAAAPATFKATFRRS
jgi:hypothetical protein